MSHVLTAADHRAIAVEVVALLTAQASLPPVDSDPWLTREQAAAYLAASPRSFARARELHGAELRPVSVHPLRWAKSTLDTFKVVRGAIAPRRTARRELKHAA